MKILRVAMDGEEHPHYTFTNAFKSAFDVKTIWWQQTENVNDVIINEVKSERYDAVFLQIQTEGIISDITASIINEYSIGFNWTGDVRNDIGWYERLGKHWVTLFTNMTDVEKMRNLGLRADYLQIGYDKHYYSPAERECHNNIVFCANYYPDKDFPLTGLRRELATALKYEFGDKFNLYGNQWQQATLKVDYAGVNNEQEAEIYRTCAIAINCSHFDYSRYSSDRLFREMACGAFVLSHKYKDIEADFSNEMMDTWQNIPELIQKCHYWLGKPDERKRIGKNAAQYAIKNATWDRRMEEFKQIIKKYK